MGKVEKSVLLRCCNRSWSPHELKQEELYSSELPPLFLSTTFRAFLSLLLLIPPLCPRMKRPLCRTQLSALVFLGQVQNYMVRTSLSLIILAMIQNPTKKRGMEGSACYQVGKHCSWCFSSKKRCRTL